MNPMSTCPSDRAVLIVLDTGKTYVGCEWAEGYYHIVDFELGIFQPNELVTKKVPSCLGTPVGWQEIPNN